MKLYHTAQSRSMRILWLLEELGLDYEVSLLPFDSKALTLADHLDVDELGALPVLVDGSVSMAESIAILHYVMNRYGDGRLSPVRQSDAYGAYLEWIHFAEHRLMEPLAQWLQHSQFLPATERNPATATRARKAFEQFARAVEKAVTNNDYLLGSTFSAADIVIGHALYLADRYGIMPNDLEHLQGYYERLSSRPAFQVAASS